MAETADHYFFPPHAVDQATVVNALLAAQRSGDGLSGRAGMVAQRAVRAAAEPALSALCRRLVGILQHALSVAHTVAQREGNAAMASGTGDGTSHRRDQDVAGGPDGMPGVTMPSRAGLVAECDALVLKLAAEAEQRVRAAFERVLGAMPLPVPHASASDGETSAAPFPGPAVFDSDGSDSSSRRGRMEEGGDDGSSLRGSSVGSTPGRRDGPVISYSLKGSTQFVQLHVQRRLAATAWAT